MVVVFDAIAPKASSTRAEAAASATSCTNDDSASLLAAKSVSLDTLTTLATFNPVPVPLTLIPTSPSSASRPATFDRTLALPCLRSHSVALVTSPPTPGDANAFLHSIMGAPVASRSCLTSCAVDGIGEEEAGDVERGRRRGG